MADPAHEAADRTIDGLRREFERVYRQAEKEARRALERHLKRFAEEDARMAERVEKGELSEEDYRHWREVKMLNGDSYRALIDQAARGYADAGAYASAAVEGRLPEVYAENVNYGTYQVESAARVDTAFALQDADTVQRLVTDRASYLPRVSHDVAKDAVWNRRLLADQITQGVMLGESVPKIAARVARVTGQNVAGATRVARTSVTAAECAGRVDSYARAKSMGIDLKQEWLATMDTRTRRSHRKLDGEKVDVGGTFSNGCRYPGDPQAPYGEICNCRCTLIAAVDGVDYSDGKRWSKLPGGMTYDDWKAGKDLDEAEWTKGGKGKPGKNGGKGKAGKKDKGGTAGSKGKADAKRKVPDTALARKKVEDNPRASIKPVNEKLYSSQVNYAERHGCAVIRGGEIAEKRLGKENDAAYSMGGRYILFQDPPTTSEVLEEVLHFKQDMRGDYSDIGGEEMILRREIDAQNYLLSVSKRYNIPRSEVEQTRKNLKAYTDRLREITEAGDDEGH